jgi:hypothetical protein
MPRDNDYTDLLRLYRRQGADVCKIVFPSIHDLVYDGLVEDEPPGAAFKCAYWRKAIGALNRMSRLTALIDAYRRATARIDAKTQ